MSVFESVSVSVSVPVPVPVTVPVPVPVCTGVQGYDRLDKLCHVSLRPEIADRFYSPLTPAFILNDMGSMGKY